MSSTYEVSVTPNAEGWSAKLEAQIGAPMRQLADQIRERLEQAGRGLDGYGARLQASLDPASRAAADQLRDRLRRGLHDGLSGLPGDSQRQGRQSGSQYADAFDREMKTKLRAALASLPNGNARLLIDGSPAEREMAKIRTELQRITDAKIGVDLSSMDALLRVDELRTRLTQLTGPEHDVRVRLNAGSALAELTAFRTQVDKLDSRTVDVMVKTDAKEAAAEFKLLQTAIALAPAVVPLAAGLTAAAAAAAGLGAAGGVALLGIKNKMDAASSALVLGRANALLPYAHELERLGAIEIAPGISVGLKGLQAAGPQVTQIVRELSGAVGEVIAGIGEGLPKALRLAMPLLLSGADAAEKLGHALAEGPSADGGFAKFLGYASQSLPATIDFIEHLAGTVGHLLEAMAPVGSVTLELVDGFVRLLDVIPTPVLTVLIGAYSVYRISTFATAAANRLLGASFAGVLGPVGLALTAVTALTVALNNAQSGSDRGLSGVVAAVTNSVQGLTDAQSRLKEGADPTDSSFFSLMLNGGGARAARDLLGLGHGLQEAEGNALVLKALIDALVPSARDLGTQLAGVNIEKAFKGVDLTGSIKSATTNYNTLTSSLSDYLSKAQQLDGVGVGTQVTINGVSYAQSEYAKALQQTNGDTATAVALLEQNRAAAGVLQTQLDAVNVSQGRLADAVGAAGYAYKLTSDQVSTYAQAIGISTRDVASGAITADQFSTSIGAVAGQLRNANTANAAWLDAVGKFNADTATAADVAGLLAAGLTASRGDALDYVSTMLGADSATQAVAKSIHDNLGSIARDGTLLGVSYVDAAGQFVDAQTKFTAGSVQISSGLQQQVQAATSAAAATYQHEAALGDTARAAQDAMTVYAGYRQSLVDQMVQSGLTTQAATGLADQYFAMPTDVDTFVKMIGEGDVTLAISNMTTAINNLSDKIATPTARLNDFATGQIDDIGRRLYQLNGASATVYVQTVGGKAALPSAYGNVFSQVGHYATGGIVDGLTAKLQARAAKFARGTELHIPQIAMPNGGVRIWAEPETQGEAYIPFAMDRRARAEDIVSQVAQRFGGAFVKPVTVSAPPVSGGGDVVAALGRVEARIGAVEAAVYAGAAHVGDRYDGAVQQAAVVAGQRAQSGPRSQAS